MWSGTSVSLWTLTPGPASLSAATGTTMDDRRCHTRTHTLTHGQIPLSSHTRTPVTDLCKRSDADINTHLASWSGLWGCWLQRGQVWGQVCVCVCWRISSQTDRLPLNLQASRCDLLTLLHRTPDPDKPSESPALDSPFHHQHYWAALHPSGLWGLNNESPSHRQTSVSCKSILNSCPCRKPERKTFGSQ